MFFPSKNSLAITPESAISTRPLIMARSSTCTLPVTRAAGAASRTAAANARGGPGRSRAVRDLYGLAASMFWSSPPCERQGSVMSGDEYEAALMSFGTYVHGW
jgi:hypothetical protein